jgi:catechol 2,3-dioxygenase-like lactoylglutathione lyase family enzyme
MRLSAAIPILRIFSEEKAKEFYVDFLGFRIEWEHRFGDNFPLYAQIKRSELIIHLSEHHGDATPGPRFSCQCKISMRCVQSFRRRSTGTASRRSKQYPGGG